MGTWGGARMARSKAAHRLAGWAVLVAQVTVAILAVAGVQVLGSSGLPRSLVVRAGAALTVLAHPGIGNLTTRAARDIDARP